MIPARLIGVVFLLWSLVGCATPRTGGVGSQDPQSTLNRYEYARVLMGTRCRIVLYASSEEEAAKACAGAFTRVAEIELASADEAFERPAWLGREATDAARYYNLALASRPYSQWSEAERAATDL